VAVVGTLDEQGAVVVVGDDGSDADGVPRRGGVHAMEILGHSRIAVTLEVYTAGDDQSQRDAIGKLADLFGSQTG
jgi:hypothetical protein